MQLVFENLQGKSGALARILKLPVIFERVLIQSGLNYIKWSSNGNFFPVKNGRYWSKWWAWQDLTMAPGKSENNFNSETYKVIRRRSDYIIGFIAPTWFHRQ